MTYQEAETNRVPRIRLPTWKPDTYIRLPLFADGSTGPWVELYARTEQEAIGVKVGSQKIPAWQFGDEQYEAYQGVPDEAEQENYAKAYSEV